MDLKELPEFAGAIEKKSGKTGTICDKTWREDLHDYLYILEYDRHCIEDDIWLSDSLTADELELIN